VLAVHVDVGERSTHRRRGLAGDGVVAAGHQRLRRDLGSDDAPATEVEDAQLVGVVARDTAVPGHVIDEQRGQPDRRGRCGQREVGELVARELHDEVVASRRRVDGVERDADVAGEHDLAACGPQQMRRHRGHRRLAFRAADRDEVARCVVEEPQPRRRAARCEAAQPLGTGAVDADAGRAHDARDGPSGDGGTHARDVAEVDTVHLDAAAPLERCGALVGVVEHERSVTVPHGGIGALEPCPGLTSEAEDDDHAGSSRVVDRSVDDPAVER
jgi:hypothetical protein